MLTDGQLESRSLVPLVLLVPLVPLALLVPLGLLVRRAPRVILDLLVLPVQRVLPAPPDRKARKVFRDPWVPREM